MEDYKPEYSQQHLIKMQAYADYLKSLGLRVKSIKIGNVIHDVTKSGKVLKCPNFWKNKNHD
jgi:hypothetical protein